MGERKVRCLDCDHEWTSKAESPRCSKAECGRSRNVEPVENENVQDDEQDDDEDEAPNTTEVSSSDENTDSTSSDHAETSSGTRRESTSNESQVSESPSETEPETAPDFSFNSNTVEEIEETETTPEKPSERDPDEKGETTPDDEQDEDDELPEVEVEQIAPAIEQTFNTIALQRGDHWKMQGENVEMATGVEVSKESAMLANAWTPVINIYAPYMVQNHMALILAASTTMSVLGPKVKKDAEIRKREAEAEETAEDESIDRRTTDAFDVEEETDTEPETVASTSSIDDNPSLSELT